MNMNNNNANKSSDENRGTNSLIHSPESHDVEKVRNVSRDDDNSEIVDKNKKVQNSEKCAIVNTVVIPTDSDILGGRGNGVNNHPGNSYFRSLVKENKVNYANTIGMFEKRKVVRQVIQKAQLKGGRFLKIDPESKTWKCISMQEAEKKTAQALREGGLTMREKFNKMNSIASCREAQTIIQKNEDEEEGREHLLLCNIAIGKMNHDTINDENVKILSRHINVLRRRMSYLDNQYNQLATKHDELISRLKGEIGARYMKKRRVSDLDDNDGLKYNDKKTKLESTSMSEKKMKSSPQEIKE